MGIDLSAGFSVQAFDVAPKDKIESTATQTYNVDAKLCVGTGATTAEITADPPGDTVYNQGSLITVCVYPDADAAADGIVMNTIDNYTWRRQDPASASEFGLNVDVNALDDGDLYTTNSDTSATIVFCIRYSLDSTGDLEVNFLESLITMDIDLSAGFSVQAFRNLRR